MSLYDLLAVVDGNHPQQLAFPLDSIYISIGTYLEEYVGRAKGCGTQDDVGTGRQQLCHTGRHGSCTQTRLCQRFRPLNQL